MLSESVKRRILPYLENLNPSQCVNYNHLNKDGYGSIQETGKDFKRHYLAHRVAFMVYHNVEIPEGKIVLHSCDNPSCVNPFHLSIGTHYDNVQDKVKKGRQAKGSKNGRYVHGHNSKYEPIQKPAPEFKGSFNRSLTKEEILEIRMCLKSSLKTCKQIAKDFSVKETVIRDISCGRTYKNV